jgi:hypothetical protein
VAEASVAKTRARQTTHCQETTLVEGREHREELTELDALSPPIRQRRSHALPAWHESALSRSTARRLGAGIRDARGVRVEALALGCPLPRAEPPWALLFAIGFAIHAFRVLRRLRVRPRWFLAWPLLMCAASIVDSMLGFIDASDRRPDELVGFAFLASLLLLGLAHLCVLDEPSAELDAPPRCQLVTRRSRRRASWRQSRTRAPAIGHFARRRSRWGSANASGRDSNQ